MLFRSERSAYVHPWTEVLLGDCLRAGYNCWVQVQNGAIIAYGIMSIGAGECHILNICVKPELHNQGYGSAMLDHLLAVAREYDAGIAFLEVRQSNHAAQKIYARAGFNEVGMRSQYYPALVGREDAIILARSLV